MLKKQPLIQPLKETVESSPFKFLKAYQTNEADLFFGRKSETKDLIAAFKKSSFVILYGPSGSGKSSLINCGLIKEINAEKVYEIRRDQHILQAIHLQLFNSFPDLPENYFVKLIQEFYGVKSNITTHYKEIEQIKKAILSANANYQRGKIDRQQLTEKVEQYKVDRNDLQVSLAAYEVLETQLEKDFIELMNKLLRHLKTSPYLIFDQFEEIFIFGSIAEIEAFGVFLSGLLDNNIPFKILLTVREEYFSKLSVFEKYLPQILYRNSFIDNPDRQTVARIIRKSFQQFNINQYYENKDWSQLKPIPQEDQEDRINFIIDQLTPINEKNENSVDLVDRNKKYHLPFLQIYLDKLYRRDFLKTYPLKPTTKLLPKFNGYLPVEFNLEEIKSFGNIDEVLKKYLHQVNQELVSSSKVKDFLGEKAQNIIVKFLKFFTTSDNTKKRLKIKFISADDSDSELIESSETIAYLENKQLSNQIQMSLWGEVNESRYLPEISRFLIQLDSNYRLLKMSQEYVELSHDVLAKIINQYHIDSDLREIYKQQFDFFFKEYLKKGDIKINYLSAKQIARYNDDNDPRTLQYILSDSKQELAEQKQKFWEESKDIVKKKNGIALLKKIGIITLIGLVVIFFPTYFGMKNQRDHANKKNETILEEQQASGDVFKASGEVHKETGSAFMNLRKDRTSAYGKILKSEKNLGKFRGLKSILEELQNLNPFNNNEVDSSITEEPISEDFLIGDIKNEFYKDFNQFPVYSKNLNFKQFIGVNKLKNTKIILSKINKDSILIFLQTPDNKLFKSSTNYKNSSIPFTKIEEVADSVQQFLPYHDEKERLCLLLIRNNHLYKQFPDSSTIKLRYKKQLLEGAVALIQIDKNKFVTNNLDGAIDFSFKDSVSVVWKKTRKSINRPIRVIQSYGKTQYLVIGDKIAMVTNFGGSNFSSYGKSFNRHNAYKATNTNKYFIGTDHIIKSNKLLNSEFHHNHEDAINNIEYYNNRRTELLILGSQDRTASIWQKGKRIKTLIGHTDEIVYANFISPITPYYTLTVSADGTLKIWDMRPIERNSEKVNRADKITKLKFNKQDGLLYIGFTFKDSDNARGYLHAACENLDMKDICCTKKVVQKISDNENLGHLITFDFGMDSTPLLGSKWTGLIASPVNVTTPIHLSGNKEIVDLAIRDSLLALARPNGMRFYPNYQISRSKQYKDRRDTLQNVYFNAVAIHPTLPIIAGAAANDILYLWNVETNKITSFIDHTDQLMDVTFSKSGKYLLTGSKDNKAILWESDGTGNFSKKSTFAHHTSDIEDVEFYEDEQFLTASRDHTVQIYQRKGEKFEQYPSLIRHDTKITAATFSLDGQYIYSGDDDGVLKKWKFIEFEKDIKDRIPIQ